jgi:hypothetical protein
MKLRKKLQTLYKVRFWSRGVTYRQTGLEEDLKLIASKEEEIKFKIFKKLLRNSLNSQNFYNELRKKLRTIFTIQSFAKVALSSAHLVNYTNRCIL